MISRTSTPGDTRLGGNLRNLTSSEVDNVSVESKELLELGFTVARNVLSCEQVDNLRHEIDRVYDEVERDLDICEHFSFRHRMLCHSTLCQFHVGIRVR